MGVKGGGGVEKDGDVRCSSRVDERERQGRRVTLISGVGERAPLS
jgi:hypothetical protein